MVSLAIPFGPGVIRKNDQSLLRTCDLSVAELDLVPSRRVRDRLNRLGSTHDEGGAGKTIRHSSSTSSQ